MYTRERLSVYTATVAYGERVAEFACRLQWEDLPQPVRIRARLALRDTLGALVAGAQTSSARIAARFAEGECAEGPARLVATGGPSGPVMAAFANGVAASALDIDDGHLLGGSIHPGAGTLPALLSAVYLRDATAVEFLTAEVISYEVAIRAGHLFWPADRSHQAHTGGTAATLGGAVGAARLLGLDRAGALRALQIASSHAPIAALQFPMVKESIGWANATAIGAARLAQEGFNEWKSSADAFAAELHPPTPFDRDGGDADPFVASLGREFELERTYFKPYAACRYTHAAADAFVDLLRDEQLSSEQIVAVRVYTHRNALFLAPQEPTSIEGAEYSFPFVLASLAVHGERGASALDDARLSDAAVRELARRVTVEHAPELDAHYPDRYPSRVEVVTSAGELLTRERLEARGSPAFPLADDELRDKYFALAEPAIGTEAAEAVSAFCDSAERESVRALLHELTANRTGSVG